MTFDLSSRRATDQDEAFLQRLFCSTREDLGLPAPLLDQQFKAQRRVYGARFPNASFEVLLLNGTPVGEMIVDRGETYRLVNIAFLPEYRSQGLGYQAIHQLAEEASSEGKDLWLSVADNNPARRLYERLGFVPSKENGLHIEMVLRTRD